MKKSLIFFLFLLSVSSVFGQYSNSASPCLFLDNVNSNTIFDLSLNRTDLSSVTLGSKILSSSSDSFNVKKISLVYANTAGGTITLGGLSNGIPGQVVMMMKTNTANSLIIEYNEAAGYQKFYTRSGGDITLVDYGGFWMVYSGTFWFVLDLP